MKKNNFKKIIIALSVFVFYIFLFDLVQAQTPYTLLEPLPGIGDETGTVSGFGAYVSGAFKLAIGLATVLAVVQLSIAGFKYMTTEAFTGKSDAKKTIEDAFFGLILLLSAYLLLRTINPDLVSQDLIIPPVGGNVKTTETTETTQKDCISTITNEPIECYQNPAILEDYYRSYFTEGVLFRDSSNDNINGCKEIGYTFELFGYDGDLKKCIYVKQTN